MDDNDNIDMDDISARLGLPAHALKPVLQLRCPDCSADGTDPEHHMVHDESCPVGRATDELMDRDRQFFADHPDSHLPMYAQFQHRCGECRSASTCEQRSCLGGLDEHDWRPTTATHAVFKCQKCDAVGFAPHPLPHNGCLGDPA